MYQVVKRDGGTVEFEISKISAAMVKAFDALEKNYHPSVINLLALQVCADFETKIRDGKIAVEDIQDSVESVLVKAGYRSVCTDGGRNSRSFCLGFVMGHKADHSFHYESSHYKYTLSMME